MQNQESTLTINNQLLIQTSSFAKTFIKAQIFIQEALFVIKTPPEDNGLACHPVTTTGSCRMYDGFPYRLSVENN
jgi:hypothetical protein